MNLEGMDVSTTGALKRSPAYAVLKTLLNLTKRWAPYYRFRPSGKPTAHRK